jgi:hypothetical protein
MFDNDVYDLVQPMPWGGAGLNISGSTEVGQNVKEEPSKRKDEWLYRYIGKFAPPPSIL